MSYLHLAGLAGVILALILFAWCGLVVAVIAVGLRLLVRGIAAGVRERHGSAPEQSWTPAFWRRDR